jgi:hypothetical protein
MDITFGWFSQLNTFLGIYSRKPGRKKISNRRHSVSIAFLVNVVEATFVKHERTAKWGIPAILYVRNYNFQLRTGSSVNIRHNVKEGLLEKSKLAQHACEEGCTVILDEARISEIESNIRYMKYKESAHMVCLIKRSLWHDVIDSTLVLHIQVLCVRFSICWWHYQQANNYQINQKIKILNSHIKITVFWDMSYRFVNLFKI